MEKQNQVCLPQSAIDTINEILSRRRNLEIAYKNGKLIIWELNSRKKYEVAIVR